MAQLQSTKDHFLKRHHTTFLVVVFIVCCLFIAGVGEYVYALRNVIFPGVQVGDIALGGKTKDEAQATLTAAVDRIRGEGFTVRADGNEQTFTSEVVSLSTQDIASSLINGDVDAAVDTAFAVGRTGSWFQRIYDQVNALHAPVVVALPVYVQKDALVSVLRNSFAQYETPFQEPRYAMRNGVVVVQQGSSGKEFPYHQVIDALTRALSVLQNDPIAVTLRIGEPTLSEQAFIEHKKTAETVVGSSIKTSFHGNTWAVPKTVLAEALMVRGRGVDAVMEVQQDVIRRYVDKVAGDINREPQEARFTLEGNKAVQFQAPQEGQKLDVNATLPALVNTMNRAMETRGDFIVDLVVIVTTPQMSSTAQEYGIRELIGIGVTHFTGSPVNRRHNIKVGSEKINGLLVAPGETFSAIGALRPFTEEAGYRAELVIKGNQTTKEIGGGMCQLGTTLFRATLNAGLPVVSRQNHSYRVPYYEPPVGMDATIYDPAPDFKFLNDTGHHILIKGYITGDNLTFEFWGTKDGREAHITDPVILSSSNPPPTKYIETLDLPLGQKTCTESAHPGAVTTFTYTVVSADGTKKERVFKSIYRPWQAVCLVGVEKLSETTDTASGDVSIAPTTP